MVVDSQRGISNELLASMPQELRDALELERSVAAQRIAELERERDNLRASHERLRQELELLKRRILIAKAERLENVDQLELEYAKKMRELDEAANTVGLANERPASDKSPASDGKPRGKRTNNSGTGRRDLRELSLQEERIEISDPHLEKLVAEGKVKRHGFDETYKLGHRRASKVRIVVARVRYKAVDADGNTDVIPTPMPDEIVAGSIAAPSLVSHIIMENIGKGMPLFRIEDAFTRDGVRIDRGTLSRWKKTVGDRLAETLVKAMHAHALATAFCIATDATGVNVQPIYSQDKGRQPCKKGHFLVLLADHDHILYEYLERETSDAIYKRFRGFGGYVQADAKSVFNVLFADADELGRKSNSLEHDGCERVECGCWYHARRRFWEAAVTKHEVGRQGLVRLRRIFELDASWKRKPPAEIRKLRELHLMPHIVSFFEWVDEQRPIYQDQRGLVRTALEYVHNQRQALTRFFEDGRLVLTNSGAERALKTVAIGRRAWLFCGSDDHAKSTAALYSVVASARLHRLDPEEYLRCLIRLVPLWPQDRMLELAPLFWERTRARLDPMQLAAEFGLIDIPVEPLELSMAAQQHATTN